MTPSTLYGTVEMPKRCPFISVAGGWRCAWTEGHQPGRLIPDGECMSEHPLHPELFACHVRTGSAFFEDGHGIERHPAMLERWTAELAAKLAGVGEERPGLVDHDEVTIRAPIRLIDGVSWMKASDAHALVGLALLDASQRATRWMIASMVGAFLVGVLCGWRWEALWR